MHTQEVTILFCILSIKFSNDLGTEQKQKIKCLKSRCTRLFSLQNTKTNVLNNLIFIVLWMDEWIDRCILFS